MGAPRTVPLPMIRLANVWGVVFAVDVFAVVAAAAVFWGAPDCAEISDRPRLTEEYWPPAPSIDFSAAFSALEAWR